MKALIWIASILITSIVVVMLNAIGIHLGGIPTMIIYAPLFFITPKLCKKWDEYKKSQKENSFNVTDLSNNVAHADEIRFCRKCGEKLIENSQFCSRCGANIFEISDIKYNSSLDIQPIVVTNIYELKEYYGKFVKITVDDLENPCTFKIRDNGSALAKYFPEEANRILNEPLTELNYHTIRGTTFIFVEPIEKTTSRDYEQKHCIYGILRRKPEKPYVLTNAFVNCTDSALRIILDEINKQDTFEYAILEDGNISIFNFVDSSAEELIIPDKIKNMPVTEIQARAFANNEAIKSVIIPYTVEKINSGAFEGCKNIESVFIGNGVQEINYAFDSCHNLQKVYIGINVSKIDSSFHNCGKLTAFTVDENNKYLCAVDGVLFSKDRSLLILFPSGRDGKYSVPEGTKVIGEGAFDGTLLTEVALPNTVERIEFGAFAWATNLKKINIPPSVTHIEYEAINSGVDGFDGEITIHENSYAQQYFKEFYLDDSTYDLNIV